MSHDALLDVLTATLSSEAQKAVSSGTKALTRSELIDAVAFRVMERMAELKADPVP